jgi:hypothetical protein
MTFPANVGAISLAAAACGSCESAGARYVASGFGNQNSDSGGSSNPSNALLWVAQQFVDQVTCQNAASFTLPVNALCSGPIPGETGTDTCQGDVTICVLFFFSNLLCKSGGPLAFDAGGGSYTLVGVVSTGTATTGGNTAICGGSGYGIYVSVSKNAAWFNGALSGDTTVVGQPITSGKGGNAAIPTSIPWYYWGIPAIVVGLGLLILIIVCCVRCGKTSAERRHQANVRRAAPPVKVRFLFPFLVSYHFCAR